MEKQSTLDKEKLLNQAKLNILKELQTGQIESDEYSERNSLDHQEVIGIIFSLEQMSMVKTEKKEKSFLKLTSDGVETLKNGSPINVFVNFLIANGPKLPKAAFSKISKEAETRGFSHAMKLKVISFDKKANEIIYNPDSKFNPKVDEMQDLLRKVSQNNSVDSLSNDLVQTLKKEKLVTVEKTKYFVISKGEKWALEITVPETDLTTELISDNRYKEKSFKTYNYNAKGLEISNGALHPLLRVRTQFREIMLELGFQEMPTNNFVESSFWNFDTLFQPQQHPARDAHDTFYLVKPAKSENLNSKYGEYFNSVKNVHEKGGHGSVGWRYNWSEEEAMKNILRTHTTAVSSKMLYNLAQEYKKTGVFTPKKFFSIDRVFRNETLDSTHLCEFHQIEGVVADYNLGLGHLIGTIQDFFLRFGIKKLRFKPAYNPYTEPSMEIFSYHEGLKRWVEIGNSGIFRPEMLAPMGLPENISVIAWGLSLERPTMIYYGLKNIRDLFGEEVQIRNTKNALMYCININ